LLAPWWRCRPTSGPGRCSTADILAWAGVAEEELTRSWGSYLQAGVRIKAATGAYLIAHVQQIEVILIRSGLKPSESLYFDQDSRVLVTQFNSADDARP
jgi:multiple sugar transport system substrate-binding protein